MVESKIFKIDKGRVVRYVAKGNLYKWLTLFILILLAGAFCALLYDWRWIVVSVMVLVVLVPGIMAICYFDYGLRPLTYFNGVMHSLRVSENGVAVDVYGRDSYDRDEENEESAGNMSSCTELVLLRSEELTPEMFRHYYFSTGQTIFSLEGKPSGILIVPADCWNKMSDYREALDILYKFCKK